ncbi:MAG: MFS transporter [Pseudomonadota bacterium]|nr:MFS transporter [Pseudomonadota bacterium]
MNKDNFNSKLAWLMCFLAALFYCYEYLLRVLPSVIVPELMLSLKIGASQVGLISSFYFLTYTPLQIVVGTIMDHFGVRLPLTIATLSCAAGILLFSQPNYNSALSGMLLIGFGSAFAFVGVLKIAADWLPNKYFALVSGLTTTLGMLGAITAETSITKVISANGISLTMHMLAGLGFFLTIFIFLLVKDKQLIKKDNYLDEIIKLAKDLLLVAKNKQIWLNGLIGMLIFTPTTTFAGLWGVPYLQMTRNIDVHQAGSIISAIFIGWAIGGPIVGLLTNYLQKRKIILTYGSLLAALVLIKIIYFPSPSIPLTTLFMFLLGIFSSSEILVFAIAHDIIDNKLAGTAVSLTNMLVMVSGAMQYIIGVTLENVASASSTISNIPQTFSETQFQSAFIIMPIGLILSFILSLLLKESFVESK